MTEQSERRRGRWLNIYARTVILIRAFFIVSILALIAYYVFLVSTPVNIAPQPPASAYPSPNAYDDYIAAGKLLKTHGGVPSLSRPFTSAEERSLVAKNADVLQCVRLGLTRQCRAPAHRSLNDNMPYLRDFRDMAALLAADARIRSAKGDHAGAVSAGLDAMQMADDTARGGTLIEALVSAAIRVSAARAIVPEMDRLSAEDWARLSPRLDRLAGNEVPVADTISEERDSLLGAIANPDAIRSKGPPSKDSLDEWGAWTNEYVGWPLIREMILHDMDAYFRRLIPELRKPVIRRKKTPSPDRLPASLLGDVYPDGIARLDNALAHRRLLYCALAIERYRVIHRKLPASLLQLGLPPAATTDPFTSDALIYRSNGRDYLLYSVGPDLRDDGGLPANEAQKHPRGDLGIRRYLHTDKSKPGVLDDAPVPHLVKNKA